LGDQTADQPEADQAECLAGQAAVGQLLGQGQQAGHSVFGDGDGASVGGVADFDAQGAGGADIDVAKAAAQRADRLEVVAVLDDVAVDVLLRADDKGLVVADAPDECFLVSVGQVVDLTGGGQGLERRPGDGHAGQDARGANRRDNVVGRGGYLAVRLDRGGSTRQEVGDVDVAAAEQHANPRAGRHGVAPAQQRGQGDGRAWLDDNLQARPDELQRVERVVLAGGGHVGHVLAHDRQVAAADGPRAQAVGNGLRDGVELEYRAVPPGAAGVGPHLRLDADNAAAGCAQMGGQGAATDKSAAANGHEQVVEWPHFFE